VTQAFQPVPTSVLPPARPQLVRQSQEVQDAAGELPGHILQGGGPVIKAGAGRHDGGPGRGHPGQVLQVNKAQRRFPHHQDQGPPLLPRPRGGDQALPGAVTGSPPGAATADLPGATADLPGAATDSLKDFRPLKANPPDGTPTPLGQYDRP